MPYINAGCGGSGMELEETLLLEITGFIPAANYTLSDYLDNYKYIRVDYYMVNDTTTIYKGVMYDLEEFKYNYELQGSASGVVMYGLVGCYHNETGWFPTTKINQELIFSINPMYPSSPTYFFEKSIYFGLTLTENTPYIKPYKVYGLNLKQ